jgi:hypothetical protein
MKEKFVADVGTSLFQPDSLLPSQFFATLKQKTHACGERRLMVAILEDAIECFQKHFWARDTRSRNLRTEAENWFLSDDESWPFSFVNVCHALDLQPEFLRRGLWLWKEQELAKQQPRLAEMNTLGMLKRQEGSGGFPEDALRVASGS